MIFDDFAYSSEEQKRKPHEHAHAAVEGFLWAVGNQFTPIIFRGPEKTVDGVRDTYQCYLKKL
jgi:hypothetical protein